MWPFNSKLQGQVLIALYPIRQSTTEKKILFIINKVIRIRPIEQWGKTHYILKVLVLLSVLLCQYWQVAVITQVQHLTRTKKNYRAGAYCYHRGEGNVAAKSSGIIFMLLADKVFKTTENNCLIKSYSTALSCRMKQLFLCSSSSSDSKILFVVLSSFPWSLKTSPCVLNKYFLFVFSPQCFLYASVWLLSAVLLPFWLYHLAVGRIIAASVPQHSRHAALQMPPVLSIIPTGQHSSWVSPDRWCKRRAD